MSNTNLTVARIRIQNTSSEPITGVRLEYYYTAWNCGLTSTPERYWTDSAAVWAEQGADTTDCYLIIDLENDTLPSGEWFPNESGWSIGLHDSAWTTWSKSNDFSQPESSAFATTNHIAVFVNDTLVQGSQPSGHAPWNWRDVRIQSFTPGAPDSCRVELVNRGSATVSLAGAVLRSHTDTLCVFADSVSLDSGEALTLWPERVDSLRAGELWLEWNGRMGAYVQWGVLDSTVGYADAILQGAWKGGWVSTRRTSYTEGDFFGILAWEDGDAPDEWNRYTATEAEQAQAGTLPTPVLHQHSGNLYLMPGDSTLTLHLGWDIVAGVDSYTVVIAADTAFTDTLQTIETTSTSATLTLDTGNTSIRVVARKINWTTLTAIVTGDPITTLVVDVWTSDDDDGEVLLTKDSIAAEKDTRMLVPEFSYDSSSFWDSPTSLSDSEWDPEIGGRCSFVALEHLNHYYGGDVTQDEIKFFVKGGFPLYNGIYPEWAPYLYHPASSYNDGGNYPETFIAATWLLGGTFQENWASHNYFLDTLKDSVVIMDHFQVDQMVLTGKNLLYYGTGAPPWDTIQSCIFEGNPIVVFTENPDHAQTIVGCLDSGAIWVHNGTLGANNGGVLAYDTSKYFHGSDSIVAYFYVKDASQVTPRKGNSLIANETDSDGDGVLDFDEIYRFKTNPYSTDTDSDGVSDKAEIASYSIYRTLNQAAMLDSSLLMPDIDGDSLRAERDPDADGGGLIDGSEDLDHDGVLDTDETSPYDSTDDAAVLAAAGLDDYALVAFGTLRLNDGVQCLDSNGNWCQVANLGSLPSNDNKTELGRSAEAGTLFSTEPVVLRNNATVHGNVDRRIVKHIIFFPLGIPTLVMQVGATVEGDTAQSVLSWAAWKSWLSRLARPVFDVTGSTTCLLEAGDTTEVAPDSCQTLTVNAGATLVLRAGTYHLTSLQIDAGARVEVDIASGPVSLLVDGNVLWRGTFLSDYEDDELAKNLYLYTSSEGTLYIDGFAGTVVAPNGAVSVGQSTKTFYGRVLAKDVSIHQYTTVHHIPFTGSLQ